MRRSTIALLPLLASVPGLVLAVARAQQPPAAPARAVQVAVGARHTCARMSDGTARCWGSNEYGQLGDGTREARARPVAATRAPGPFDELVAGAGFTCARRHDGTVLCWGYNRYGELGGGTASEGRDAPAPVLRVRGATALRAGEHTVCAVVGGRLHCWGRLEPNWDQANPAPRYLATPPALVSATVDDFACVIRQDHTLWCWGANHRPRPTSMGVEGAQDVAQGGLGACVALQDGTVRCWGWNDSGQLGRAYDRERDDYSTTPTAVAGVAGARRVVAGGSHRCALLQNGTVSCWGASWSNPGFPAACLQTTRHSSGGGSARQWQYCPTPTVVPELRDVVDLDARDERTCAVTRAGDVACWGSGERFATVHP